MLGKKPTYTGRDQTPHMDGKPSVVFQSTRPIRGATLWWVRGDGYTREFQSTRPVRGATCQSSPGRRCRGHFNPRAPYGARQKNTPLRLTILISIHAPHTGRDVLQSGLTCCTCSISIHAPHTGRDAAIPCTPPPGVLFQSTRPIRGATALLQSRRATVVISIHAPHTGRDLRVVGNWFSVLWISIHAPHTGRDLSVSLL